MAAAHLGRTGLGWGWGSAGAGVSLRGQPPDRTKEPGEQASLGQANRRLGGGRGNSAPPAEESGQVDLRFMEQ